MGKIVKFRLVTYFEEGPNPVDPQGGNVLTERIASMGAELENLRPVDEARLEGLGAFYTDEEADQIRKGTYRGFDAEILARFREGVMAGPNPVEPVDGEGPQTADMSAEELGEYIKENRLNVDATVALAGDDLDSIEKVLDAENIATDNDPRKGVSDALEAKMKAVASQ